MKKKWLLLVIILIMMLVAGCGESSKANREILIEKVSMPLINIGNITSDYTEVTISSKELNAVIIYTVDGSEPTEKNGKIYEKALNINKTTKIKAKAFKTGMTESDTAEKTISVTEKIPEITVQSISIKTMPLKTNYYVGEKNIDITGLVVEGTYSDGSKKSVEITVSNITGFDTVSTGIKSLKITYNGKSTTFNITVINIELQSISIKTMPLKTNYYVGEKNIDITGLVVEGIYLDGSKKSVEITVSNITGFDTVLTGIKSLKVAYNGKSTTFNITVNDEILKGIFTVSRYIDFLKINEYSAEFEVLDSTVTKIVFSGTANIRPKEVVIINKKGTLSNIKVASDIKEIILTAFDSKGNQVGNSKTVKLQ